MPITTYDIQEERNEFHDNLLDIIGREFNFDHAKGLSEWLKNSVDAYRRISVPDSDQHVLLRFTDGRQNDATVECIDFASGMTSEEIDAAFKRWGDPEAAKRGRRNLKTYGGHGNGGKFYMRQMFETSHFITYKNGMLNVFGFNATHKYGFAEGYKDREVSLEKALEFAGILRVIPPQIKSELNSSERGFMVVLGKGPKAMKNCITVRKLCEDLRNQPQARQLLFRINVKVIYNNDVYAQVLRSEKPKPYEGFEGLPRVSVPDKLTLVANNVPREIKMSNDKYAAGYLQLYTSEIAMERNHLSELNRIDILGDLGVIASYRVHELEYAGRLPQRAFIYGECECPILEDPEITSVIKNDRSKLVASPMSNALLQWIGEQVHDLSEQLARQRQTQNTEVLNDLSAKLNNYLNNWKDKYANKILAEILSGADEGPGKGFGDGGEGLEVMNGGKVNSRVPRDKREHGSGGGNTPKRGKRSLRVLVSGIDKDPLGTEGNSTLLLHERQGVIYQRPEDVEEGIYWINREAPLAQKILKNMGTNTLRWRDYLFQRYVDIFIKEALTAMDRKEPEDFNATSVESTIGSVISKIHKAAAEELNEFLFEQEFEFTT